MRTESPRSVDDIRQRLESGYYFGARFEAIDDLRILLAEHDRLAAGRRLAEEALKSLDRRKDEDVEAWAARLASDVAKADD